jgi:dCMP deaminase
MTRPNINRWGMNLAEVVATRSTCLRRQVGCVLMNNLNHVVATGYNGVCTGSLHCNYTDTKTFSNNVHPFACDGAHSESGTNLDGCKAIHAEQNALLQCRDVYSIATAYVTASPCMTCVKLLLNTSCQKIVFFDQYPHSEASDMWRRNGRVLLKLDRWASRTSNDHTKGLHLT